nr:unnamed protein product [Leishmania braziliensis]
MGPLFRPPTPPTSPTSAALFHCDRFSRFSSFKMAKSKNHTNHNQSSKNHRNGIKGPMPLHLCNSKRGGWLPALVNTRRVRKHNQKAALKRRRERIAAFAAKN